jgi:hypothetical protein
VVASRLRVVLVALAAMAAACSSSSTSSRHRFETTTTRRVPLPAPCSLLTATDARTFLQVPARRVPATTATDRESECAYAAFGGRQLLLLRETNDVQVLSAGLGGSPVAVGEEAYLRSGVPPGTTTLDFRQHGVVVSLLYSNLRAIANPGGASGRDDQLVALGQGIAARL